MGFIARRGKKLYLRYIDADGTERMRLARGATTLAEARPLLAAIELRIKEGQVGIEELVEETAEQKRRRTITVKELSELFLKEYRGSKKRPIKDIEVYRAAARSKFDVRLNPLLGSRKVRDLTAADVERATAHWATVGKNGEPLAGSSVNGTLALMSAMFSWANRVGYSDKQNPCTGVARGETNKSLDYLSKTEVPELLRHREKRAEADDDRLRVLYPMVATGVYAGLRKGELFGLRWIHVHFDAQRIDVMHSYERLPKSGKERSVPLHPVLATILRAWRQHCPKTDRGLVFPVGGRMGSEYETLGLADELTAAGCHLPDDGHVWHMLRHTFASHAVMSGSTLYDVQKMLGHRTASVTAIYAKLAPDHLLAQVARMSFAAPPVAGMADITEERRQRAIEAANDGTGTVQTDTPTLSISPRIGVKLA